MYKDKYKISSETQKLALSLIKDKILIAYDNINSNIKEKEINIKIQDFNISLPNNININEVQNKINNYVNNKYQYDDKQLFIYILIASITLTIGIILSLKIPILSIILLLVLIGIDAYLIYNIIKNRKKIDNIKLTEQNNLNIILESSMAELTDYKNIINEKQKVYEELKNFLNSIDTNNYLKTRDERNIEIGE